MPDALPIPAATLVIFREVGSGPPELLMVERAQAMVFAAGALVFPGGRIDPGDHELAERTKGPSDDTAARIAAIRETIEEAGLAIGLAPSPAPEVIAGVRRDLHAGRSFADALADTGTALDLDALEPFARWLPAHASSRTFDTRFYLARLPADAPPATVDATENVRLVWGTARHILDDADAGRVHVIFPTRRNLERLAQMASVDEAIAHARAYPIRTVTPWAEDRGGIAHLCIPDDLGYPVTAEPMSSTLRG